MRLFLAIDFSPGIKKKIYQNINLLRPYIPKGVKWVEEENLHVTFKFLGDVPPDQIDVLSYSTQEVTDRFPPFKMKFGGISVIPNPQRPRVIWYDLFANKHVARNIFKDVERKLAQVGFKKSKHPLKLHATLGRVKYSQNVNWKKILAKAQPIPDSFECSKLTLFKSKLTPQGPIYTIEKTFLLNRK